jgi:hypothetical protein
MGEVVLKTEGFRNPRRHERQSIGKRGYGILKPWENLDEEAL